MPPVSINGASLTIASIGNLSGNGTRRYSLKLVKITGFVLTLVGLFLSFPPVARVLAFNFGMIGGNGGLVIFAVGWALLLGHLAYSMSMERQREK